MKEKKGNLFDAIYDDSMDCICITTNGIVNATGLAIMGAGVAGEAARRWPNIRACLGRLLREHGNRLFLLGVACKDGQFRDPRDESFNDEIESSDDIACMVASFPTKNDFRFKSDLSLIEQSTKQLVDMANKYGMSDVGLSRPGCSNGGLRWVDVKAVIEPLLDDRFTIFSFEGEE